MRYLPMYGYHSLKEESRSIILWRGLHYELELTLVNGSLDSRMLLRDTRRSFEICRSYNIIIYIIHRGPSARALGYAVLLLNAHFYRTENHALRSDEILYASIHVPPSGLRPALAGL
jgi:hypothetical protein